MNWVVYKVTFLWSTDARGYADHVDSSGATLVDPITRTDAARALTAVEVAFDVELKKALKI